MGKNSGDGEMKVKKNWRYRRRYTHEKFFSKSLKIINGGTFLILNRETMMRNGDGLFMEECENHDHITLKSIRLSVIKIY